MSVLCRTAAVPRESTAVGVCSSPLRRISSEMPGTMRSATACVASGVLSRGPMPVPPVVSKTSTRPESASSRKRSRIPAGSSEIGVAAVTSQPSPRQAATTAGPERSSCSPLATLSLIVRTATRMRRESSVKSGRRHGVLVAIRHVHQPHRFHQQSRGVFCRSGTLRSISRVVVDLNVRTAGHEQKGDMARRIAGAQLFKKLPAVQYRHLVVTKNHVGRSVHYFEQGVRTVLAQFHFAERFEPFDNQVAHQRIIFRQQQPNRFAARRIHRARLTGAALRRKSPLLPPVFWTSTTSVISIPLSRALHIS